MDKGGQGCQRGMKWVFGRLMESKGFKRTIEDHGDTRGGFMGSKKIQGDVMGIYEVLWGLLENTKGVIVESKCPWKSQKVYEGSRVGQGGPSGQIG